MKHESRRKYRIHQVLHDEIHGGHVWIRDPGLDIKWRPIVKIRFEDRTVYCEALTVDRNYLKKHCAISPSPDDVVIAMSQWYRDQLHIAPKTKHVELHVTVLRKGDMLGCIADRCGRVHACLHHPQAAVRVGTRLGIIGAVLGIIGAAFGFIGLFGGLSGFCKFIQDCI